MYETVLEPFPQWVFGELTISFLIGPKRTVNFQRLRRHLAAVYTIIMSRTRKVSGNRVMYDHGA